MACNHHDTVGEAADEECMLAVAALLLHPIRKREKEAKDAPVRGEWVKKHLLDREDVGAHFNLIPGLRERDDVKYRNFLRVSPEIFDLLLEVITPAIVKRASNFRAPISPSERLTITLRFLATGETFRSLEMLFRVGETTIGEIVPQVCKAIYEGLKDEYLKCPSNPEEWKAVADKFWARWQMPNCLGALDGKHIVMRPPIGSGSTFFNYKGMFSIVLMALVDADYRFIYMDVGCNGRVSDGGVFNGSSLQEALERRSANFPAPAPCPGDERSLSYYIVADEAFGLKENIMKPFNYKDQNHQHKIFNYRLSRARRVVENAFGILANRWRVFQTKIALHPSKVEGLVLAACALHNLLRSQRVVGNEQVDVEDPDTHAVIPGSWRSDPMLLQATLPVGTNTTNRAHQQREYLVQFVNSAVGAVDWQENCL